MAIRSLLCIATFCFNLTLFSEGRADDLFSVQLIQDDLENAKRALIIFDLNDDGSIDQKEQELVDWEVQRIERYDLNDDGRLTHCEVAIRFAHHRSEHGITRDDVNTVRGILKLHDKDLDGKLSADEARRWVGMPGNCDLDEDTFLSVEEIRRAAATEREYRRLSGIEGADQNIARKLMARLDKDGDRQLDITEFSATPVGKMQFKDIDANESEKIDLMELATSFVKYRRKLGVTAYDQTQMRGVFERDQNRDGVISLLDFPATLTQIQAQGTLGPGHPLQKMLARFDTNGDQAVSREEVESVFVKERKRKGSLLVDHQLGSKMFIRHDRDQSKFVEEEELFDSPRKGQLAKTVLVDIDLNQDGKLSLDELISHFATQRKAKK